MPLLFQWLSKREIPTLQLADTEPPLGCEGQSSFWLRMEHWNILNGLNLRFPKLLLFVQDVMQSTWQNTAGLHRIHFPRFLLFQGFTRQAKNKILIPTSSPDYGRLGFSRSDETKVELFPLTGIGGHVSQPLQFRSGIRVCSEDLRFTMEAIPPKGHTFSQGTGIHYLRECTRQLCLAWNPSNRDAVIKVFFDQPCSELSSKLLTTWRCMAADEIIE